MNINLGGFSSAFGKARRQRFTFSSFFFIFAIGAVFTVAGFFMVKNSQVNKSWPSTEGRIVEVKRIEDSDGSDTYSGIYQYEVDGQTYRVGQGYSSSFRPKMNSTTKIYYNPSDPGDSKADEGAAGLWIYLFPVIGIMVVILSPVFYVRSLIRGGKIKNLVETGQKVTGVLVDVQDTGYSENNNKAYKIVVAATNSAGQTQNYVSDNVMNVGGLLMTDIRNTPIPIDVYLDPDDPNNYYVDISDIPNITPQRIQELLAKATGGVVGSNTMPESFVPQSKNTVDGVTTETPSNPTENPPTI